MKKKVNQLAIHRAKRAFAAQGYPFTSHNPEQQVSETLANLLHFCAASQLSFRQCLQAAHGTYESESVPDVSGS